MAVAALSTSAIALATVSAPAPATATGEASEAFAKLVTRAKPDGRASQGEARPGAAEDETSTADAPAEEGIATAEGEAKAAPTDKADLLAELEAIFAAAAQIGIAAPVPAATPTALPATAGFTPDGVPADITSSPKSATFATPTGFPIAAQPMPVDSFAAKLADLTMPIDPAAATDQAESAVSPIAAEPAADTPATTPLRSDIAAIVASLKTAFHPTEVGGESPVAAPAPSTPPAIAAVMPSMHAPPAVDAHSLAAVMPSVAAPMADAATAPPIEVGTQVDEAVSPVALPEMVKKAVKEIAPKAVTPDRPALAVATNTVELAAPDAPRADAPILNGSEPAAAIAASTIATAPLSTAPLVPSTAMPIGGAEAPIADAPAATAATNHAEQSVVRHLDLARDTQWLDQLARDISQSVSQQNHLKFQLNPEHLGALTVEIANSAAGTAIKLTAETDQARAIIADAQPRLLAEVRAQGLRVTESHVDLNQQGGGGSTFAQGQQRQSSEDSKPFVRTPTVNREDAGDSAPREDDELYA